MDILASTAVFYTVKVSDQSADADHPFGHKRAEPIAALIVAVFTGILGFEILREALMRIINGSEYKFAALALWILLAVIIIKLGMYTYLRKVIKKEPSQAIKAGMIDCRNDVLTNSIALIGVGGIALNIRIIDNIAAVFIAGWVFYSGYKIAMENLKYLMGESPSPRVIKRIKTVALGVKEVKGINTMRAHFVGTQIHVELAVRIKSSFTVKEGHDIGESVKNEIKKIKDIEEVFVHIDAV